MKTPDKFVAEDIPMSQTIIDQLKALEAQADSEMKELLKDSVKE